MTEANSADRETWPVSQTLSLYLAFPLFPSQTKLPFSLLRREKSTGNSCPTYVFHSEIPRVTVKGAAYEVASCRLHMWIQGCPGDSPCQLPAARAPQAAPFSTMSSQGGAPTPSTAQHCSTAGPRAFSWARGACALGREPEFLFFHETLKHFH